MSNRTCIENDCLKPPFGRGMCRSHYRRAALEGTITLRKRGPKIHILSNVDPDAMTGDCAACGPTVLRRKVEKGRARYQCRVGYREGRRNRVRSPSETNPEKRRDYDLRSIYGITLADYESMSLHQGARCAICDRPEEAGRLAVDHNHETGEVRGLLCRACNTGIGCLGDSPARLLSAVLYLNAFTSAGKVDGQTRRRG